MSSQDGTSLTTRGPTLQPSKTEAKEILGKAREFYVVRGGVDRLNVP